MGLDRNLNAAELHATRNRVSVSPDLIRRLGSALGYDAIEAFGSEAQSELNQVFDLGDIIDLMLLSQLSDMEVAPGMEQQVEGDVAKQLLRRISAGDYLTRRQVHDRLPRATVMLYRMGIRGCGLLLRASACPRTHTRQFRGPFTAISPGRIRRRKRHGWACTWQMLRAWVS